MAKQLLTVRLHNRFTVLVEGNPEGIDVLKGLLIPNEEVRSMQTYSTSDDGKAAAMIESLSYTTIKEMRKAASA